MADIKRTVEIIFSGINRTGNALGDIGNDLEGIGTKGRDAFGGIATGAAQLDSVVSPIGDAATNLVLLEAGALAAGAAFVTFATVQSAQFTQAFNEITTLLGDEDPGNLESFKDNLRGYAAESTQSLDSITGAVYSAISAGVSYTDSLDVVADAEKLAVAGKGDLDTTLVALVSTLNAYGESTEESTRYSDLLFQTVKAGQTTLPELAQSLSNVTAIAGTAGVPFEEITAAIATLTASGAPTSQAITSIQAAIAAIIKPTKEAQETAERLGIGFGATALETKGLAGVLADVQEATGGSKEELTLLFGGVEALKSVLPLTGTQATKFAENLDSMSNSAGVVEAAFEKMQDNIDLQFQRIKNSFDSILLGIGAPLEDEFGGIAGAITQIFLAIGRSIEDGALEDLVKYVEGNLQEVEDIFKAVAENLPEALELADLSGFTDGIDAVKEAIDELFGDIDLTSPEGLATVITGLGDAFNALSQFTAGFIESFETAVSFIQDNTSSFDDLGDSFFRTAGQIGGFAEQASILTGAVGGLASSLEILVDIIAIRAGANLLKSATGAGGAIGGLSRFITGPAGLVAAAGAGGYAIGSFIEEQFNLGEVIGGWAFELLHGNESLEETAKVAPAAGRAAGGLADEFNKAGTATEDVAENIAETAKNADDAEQPLDNAAKATKSLGDEAERAARLEKSLADAEALMEQATRDATDAVDKQEAEAKALQESLGGLIPIYDEATGRIIGFDDSQRQSFLNMKNGIEAIKDSEGNILGFTSGIKGAGDASDKANAGLEKGAAGLDKAAKAAEKAAEEAEKVKLKLLELATDEKIALIEARVELNTAQLQAQVDLAEIAFGSLDNTISSTGETISALFGALVAISESGGTFNQAFRLIEEQLELENRLREEAAELQKEYTQALIDEVQARAERLRSDRALIEVDGTGLEPHLEAIMFEILEAVQVRVSEEGLQLLLGGTP